MNNSVNSTTISLRTCPDHVLCDRSIQIHVLTMPVWLFVSLLMLLVCFSFLASPNFSSNFCFKTIDTESFICKSTLLVQLPKFSGNHRVSLMCYLYERLNIQEEASFMKLVMMGPETSSVADVLQALWVVCCSAENVLQALWVICCSAANAWWCCHHHVGFSQIITETLCRIASLVG